MFKYIGKEEQLKEYGFVPYYDENIECITSFSRPSKIIDNDVMIAWELNCSLDKGEIGSVYNYETIVAEDIKDLIDDGLIEVLEDV
jgi:hypothetical protein